MLQQIVVDPIRSRCTGFGLHDWPPQISQAERLNVNFSVVRGEVNFDLLFLLFYGLECSTVVGRGGVVCKCCCMFISHIFRLVMVVPFFPFRYCLGGQILLPDIFPTLSHACLMGVSADSFETYFAHDLRFFWLKSRQACACDFLKAVWVSPLNSRLRRTLLSRAHLAFRASRHSPSNQGFDFLGMVVALGMLSFAALVMCSTKECKGSPSSRMSSVILTKHRSSNSSQSALENTQWEGSQLGCVSDTGGRIEVSMG